MPRVPPFDRPATYEDLLQVPAEMVAEILEGELHVSPRPAIRHAQATSVLTSELIVPYHLGRGGPGGWWILFEPELHLSGDILVPDIAGWHRTRLSATKVNKDDFVTVVPDWVCETLSPATALIDRTQKLRIYRREAVQHIWLLDPTVRTLEVLRLDKDRWTVVAVHGGTDIVRAEPFTDVGIELASLWPQ